MSFQQEIDQDIRDKKLYFLGDSLPLDWYAAFKTWLPLAESGDPKAQFNIGRCLVRGTGIEQNIDLGIEWLEKAAAQNEPRSYYNLYYEYDNRKSERAKVCFDKAVELKEARALGKVMSDKRREAQRAWERGEVSQAKQMFTELVAEGDRLSRLGLMSFDVDVQFEQSSVIKYQEYTEGITTSYGGYVSGGGTRTSALRYPAILMKFKNNSKERARMTIFLESYDYADHSQKKGEEVYATPILLPGQSCVLTREVITEISKPARIYYVGITYRHEAPVEDGSTEALGFRLENKRLLWEPNVKPKVHTSNLARFLKALAYVAIFYIGAKVIFK